ncbi:MAG TPA: hypothetical protein VFJ85_10520 [Acidimicrobiales bacterium]|nr:hypothetical protein [Acidimicrobiales bacterium]
MTRAPSALRALLAVVAVAGLLGACGGGSSGGGVESLDPGTSTDATVRMAMAEYKYTPNATTVASGQAVRFEFPNAGSLQHEARVGTMEQQEAYEKDRSGPGADLPSVLVQPGQTGELLLRFAKPGTYVIGCHELGHWAAGQKATVTVR